LKFAKITNLRDVPNFANPYRYCADPGGKQKGIAMHFNDNRASQCLHVRRFSLIRKHKWAIANCCVQPHPAAQRLEDRGAPRNRSDRSSARMRVDGMLKDDPTNILQAIDLGTTPLAPESATQIVDAAGYELTPREFQILELVRDGNRNKRIADRLSISLPTVNFHFQNLTEKLGARTRTHAVVIALRRGLLSM
jgi:DNA-binding CsgD family transcriptional regulator